MSNRHNSTKLRFSYQQPQKEYPGTTNRQSVFTSMQTSTTPTFMATNRAASLPPQRVAQSGPPMVHSHINIVEKSPQRQKSRQRKKIFDENGLQMQRSMTVSRPPVMMVQTPQKMEQPVKITSPLQIQKEQSRVLRESDIVQLDQTIYRRIIQKLSQTQISPKKEVDVSTITSKQQEINYLKLEVERLKRCQKLSKENENLYKRLVDKLKEHSVIVSPDKSRKRVDQMTRSPPGDQFKSTPLNSLNGMRRSEPQQEDHIIYNKQGRPQTSPAKQHIQSPMFLNSQAFSPPTKFEDSQTMTFKRSIRGRHAKQLKPQTYTVQRLKQRMVNSLQGSQMVHETQLSQRLEQMNGQLQRSMVKKRYQRSSSRPKVTKWSIDYHPKQYMTKTTTYNLDPYSHSFLY